MSEKNDGGPAFPLQVEDRDQHEGSQYGMSLRDYFAGQVIGSLVHACAADTRKEGMSYEEHIARNAYEIADAMLNEREKT